MSFLYPSLLLALAGLPVLWWLLKAIPPPPKKQAFPAIRLLHGLVSQDSTVERTPWWLLLLRAAIAILVIAGFAGPVLRAVPPPPRSGPLLLVIDDGWASAPDWPMRIRAADIALDQATRADAPVSLLTTADDENGHLPQATRFATAATLRPILAALKPKPFAPNRAAAAEFLAHRTEKAGWTVYIADGVAQPSDPSFAEALATNGPISEERAEPESLHLIRASGTQGRALTAILEFAPSAQPRTITMLAQTANGGSLAQATATVPAHEAQASTSITLPADLRNRLSQLAIEPPLQSTAPQSSPSTPGISSSGPGAGSVFLLDDSAHLHPVGLLSAGQAADLPLTGGLFYIRQALLPGAEIHEGDLPQLLGRKLSVIIDTNPRLDTEDAAKLRKWVAAGGWLIRFAGFDMVQDDPLEPVALAAGNRQLGGAMTWEQPAHLESFPPDSPFAGLTAPTDVTVSRQVMAQPTPGLSAHSWAHLTDGTPLVTWTTIGDGKLVLFHVTASPSWSSLPLSGIFPQMLKRLIASSGGVGATGKVPHGNDRLNPVETLNGFGVLGSPPAAAMPIQADQISTAQASAQHPPGFYGSADYRVALNVGPHAPPLHVEQSIGTLQSLDRIAADRDLTGLFLAAALLLFLLDWLVGMRLRGLLAAMLLPILLSGMPHQAHAAPPEAALHLRLAWVGSNDSSDNSTAENGLKNLSAYVNAHTAIKLADPQPVTPGVDDLSFYPLLYWPVSDNTNLSPEGVAALNRYMALGGFLVIDTRNAGGDAGGAQALRHIAGLNAPPLMPLTPDHVLNRAFYLTETCGGRANGPIWLARPAEAGGDQVSPILIGGNDWAAAWAAGGAAIENTGPSFGYDQSSYGSPYGQAYASPYDVDPQTKLAFHCGVNLVMYALTGTYKADQQHVQKLLDGLGH